MAKDPLLPDPPKDGNAWENLASNLFGVDLNSAADDEIVSPEELAALDAEVEPDAPAEIIAEQTATELAAPEPAPSEPAVSESIPAPELDDDDLFAAFNDDDDDDEAPRAESPEFEGPEDEAIEAVPEVVAMESQESVESSDVEAVAGPAATDKAASDTSEDKYWDPLAAWEWDAEEIPSSGRGGRRERRPPRDSDRRKDRPATGSRDGRGRREPRRRERDRDKEKEDLQVKGPGTDARRAADSFDTVSDYRDEYDKEDGEFGAGLLDEGPPADTPAASADSRPRKTPTSDSPDATDRRKSRRAERKRAAEDVPAKQRTEDVKPLRPAAEERLTDEDATGDEGDAFGSGLLESAGPEPAAEAEEPAPRRQRTRRRRRRRTDRSPDAAPETADNLDDQHDRQARSTDDDDAASEKEGANYHNIPTWEEAISYLTGGREPAETTASPSQGSSAGRPKTDSENAPRRRRRRRPSR
ncbi:MAG: hypothetical protein ACE5KM_11860 [Planctomycetaceae bacterium]